MNKTPKVSVIIPVYNVEKFLSDCIDSVISQTYKNLDIILVNDGSTDKSKDISLSYEQKDDRIRVVNQPNQGVAVARNNGLSAAKGDYVIFVDSDDCLALNAIENLCSLIEIYNADFVNGSQITVDDKWKIDDCGITSGNLLTIIKNKAISDIKIERHMWVHNTLFRKDFIADVRFKEGLHPHEDTLFFIQLCEKAVTIVETDQPVTYYRVQDGGVLMRAKKDLTILPRMNIILCDELYKLYEKNNNKMLLQKQIDYMMQGLITDKSIFKALVGEDKHVRKLAINSINKIIEKFPQVLLLFKKKKRIAIKLIVSGYCLLGMFVYKI